MRRIRRTVGETPTRRVAIYGDEVDDLNKRNGFRARRICGQPRKRAGGRAHAGVNDASAISRRQRRKLPKLETLAFAGNMSTLTEWQCSLQAQTRRHLSQTVSDTSGIYGQSSWCVTLWMREENELKDLKFRGR